MLSCLTAPNHTLFPNLDRKLISVVTLNLVPNLLKKLLHLAKSYHVLSNLIVITPYHYLTILSRMFYGKLISVTTLNLLKKLPYHATSYHPCLTENYSQ